MFGNAPVVERIDRSVSNTYKTPISNLAYNDSNGMIYDDASLGPVSVAQDELAIIESLGQDNPMPESLRLAGRERESPTTFERDWNSMPNGYRAGNGRCKC